jgi:GntR family transcriptional regulator
MFSLKFKFVKVSSSDSRLIGFSVTPPLVTKPLYYQVRELLLGRISSGVWGPGDAIPNEYELAASLNVSLGTIRKALNELVSEKVIFRKQGRGTFVIDQSSATATLRYSKYWSRTEGHIEGLITESHAETGEISEEEAERLVTKKNYSVLRVMRVRSNICGAFSVEKCVLPAVLYPSIPEDLCRYRIGELAQTNGIQIGDADESVGITRAEAFDVKALEVAMGEPLLSLDRVIRSMDGRPLEWRTARLKTGDVEYRNQFQ